MTGAQILCDGELAIGTTFGLRELAVSGRGRAEPAPFRSIAVLLTQAVRHKARRVPTQTVADASFNQNDKRYEDHDRRIASLELPHGKEVRGVAAVASSDEIKLNLA